MANVGYVGLGIMGGPMARHLAAAPHSVVVYNRTTAKAEEWVKAHGGSFALTPREVAEVVRNLAARDRDSALSAAEKTMYDRARINLISEISPALKVSTDAAEVWLDAALEQGVLKPSKGAKLVKQAAKPAPKVEPKATAKSVAKPAAKVAKAPAKTVAKAAAKK